MNDLRSRNRALAAVPDEGSAPTSTPPRVRPDSDEQAGRRMSRRQSIAERARRLDAEHEAVADAGPTPPPDDHKFTSSRPGSDEAGSAVAEVASVTAASAEAEGPASRPSRRREVGDDVETEEDRFPWHFQFDHDEPEELHASSPLLSRAFRATIG